MSNIKTSPSSPLTICGSITKVDWSAVPSPKPGSTKEASPAVSSSVTITAADHSPHSRFSILRKCAERVSGDLLFLTGTSSRFMRLMDDHPLESASFCAIRLPAHEPWLPRSASERFLVRCPRNFPLIPSIPLRVSADQFGDNALIFDGCAGEGRSDLDIRALLANAFPDRKSTRL